MALTMAAVMRGIGDAAAELTPGPDKREACCIFVRRALELAGMRVDDASITLWYLWPSEGDPWGPVTAAVRCGAAPASTLVPMGAYVVQGWRDKPFGKSGHCLFVVQWGGAEAYYYDSAAKRPGNGDGAHIDPLSWLDEEFPGGWKAAKVA